MRIHVVHFLLALTICALLTYGIVSIDANAMKSATGPGSFILFGSTLGLGNGVQLKNERLDAKLGIVAMLFFVAALLLNLLFALIAFSQAAYIGSCAIVLFSYGLAIRSIFSAHRR